jgi:hypothetical protein
MLGPLPHCKELGLSAGEMIWPLTLAECIVDSSYGFGHTPRTTGRGRTQASLHPDLRQETSYSEQDIPKGEIVKVVVSRQPRRRCSSTSLPNARCVSQVGAGIMVGW